MVFDRDLRRFREAVRSGRFDVTLHGFEEMQADGLSVLDLESCVLSGRIVERQLDRTTGERKFVIEGRSVDDQAIALVVKHLGMGRMGVLTVFTI